MEWERSCTADRKTTRSFQGRLLYIQPKQFPVDASGRGDNRRQEGVTQTGSLVPPALPPRHLSTF